MNWANERLVAIDTETTGKDTMTARVWEFGIARQIAGLVSCDSRIIAPGVPIPNEIIAICGLSRGELMVIEHADPFERHAAEIAGWLSGEIVVGYNILGYDWPLLVEEFRRTNVVVPAPRLIIDVLVLARHLMPGGSHRLGVIAERVGVKSEGAHRAEADCMMTLAILRHMQKDLPEGLDELSVFLEGLHTDQCALREKYGHWLREDSGVLVLACGKHEGLPLSSVPRSYRMWALQNATMTDGAREAFRASLRREEVCDE